MTGGSHPQASLTPLRGGSQEERENQQEEHEQEPEQEEGQRDKGEAEQQKWERMSDKSGGV